MNDGQTKRVPPSGSALTMMFWTLMFIVLSNVGMIALGHWMMPLQSGLSMFAGWIAQLAVILGLAAWIYRMGGGINLILIIGFAVYSLVYGIMPGHILRLFTVRETPTISLSEVDQPQYANCDVFHLSEGHVDERHSGSRKLTRRGSGMATYDHVSPVIPANWKAGDPIRAWVAVQGADRTLPAEWKQDLKGGYRVAIDPSLSDLIRETCELYSLHTSPTAPMIFWSGDPLASLRRLAGFELGILLGIDSLGFLVLLLSMRGKPGSR